MSSEVPGGPAVRPPLSSSLGGAAPSPAQEGGFTGVTVCVRFWAIAQEEGGSGVCGAAWGSVRWKGCPCQVPETDVPPLPVCLSVLTSAAQQLNSSAEF